MEVVRMGIMNFVREKMKERKLDYATKITQQSKKAEADINYYKYVIEKEKKIEEAEKLKTKAKKIKKDRLKRKLSGLRAGIEKARKRTVEDRDKIRRIYGI